MAKTFPHPRDPALLLSAPRPPFGAWRLLANGVEQEPDDEDRYHLRLSDGSASTVEVISRRFDPFPVFVIDGTSYPLGADLGVAGVIGLLLPLMAIARGLFALLLALCAIAIILRASRAGLSAPFRVVLGVLGAVVAIRGSDMIGAYIGRKMEPMYANRAAADALPRIPAATQVPAIPIGTDPVAPITVADLVVLRRAVLARDYATADTTLARLLAGARRDVRRETPLRTMFETAFYAQGPQMEVALERWVAAEPANPAAHLARGWHRYWTGDAVRTGGSGAMTAPEVHAYLQGIYDAAAEATSALQHDGSYLPAFWLLEYLAQIERDQATAVKLLDLALLRSPSSFESYQIALLAQSPYFGGSYTAIDRLALRADAAADANPDLRTFEDFSAWLRIEQNIEEPTESEIDSLRTIVAHHPYPRYVHSLGHALWHGGHGPEALVYLDSALALDPLLVEALVTRRKYWYNLPNDSAHTADSLTVVAIEPRLPYN